MLAILAGRTHTCGPRGALPQAEILIEGEKIVPVEERPELPPGTQVVDASALTVRPSRAYPHLDDEHPTCRPMVRITPVPRTRSEVPIITSHYLSPGARSTVTSSAIHSSETAHPCLPRLCPSKRSGVRLVDTGHVGDYEIGRAHV